MAIYPTLISDCLTISITKLKEWKYLELNQSFRSTLTWSRNNVKTGSISIYISTQNIPFIELSYNCNGEPIKYSIDLIRLPSNLGKGFLWYFKCPQTGKLCRKLYQYNKYFYHRTVYNLPYEKQIRSKKNRDMDTILGALYGMDEIYEQIYKKHLKKHYKGKPTKKYAKLKYLIDKADSVSPYEFERFLIS